MEFNSLEFFIFYTVFFAAYWALRSGLRWQNRLLLAASYVFYGWWDWRFLGLIILITVISWSTALMAVRRHRLGWTALNVTVSLCVLGAFKYFGFFGKGIARLVAVWGWNIDTFTTDILLPVGISFYTFQAISYSVDVYRRRIEPTRDLLTFATFIAIFPQLLAGPIERGGQLLPQIARKRKWDYNMAVDGARETLWGLFKKVAVADMCGLYVDAIYNNPSSSPFRLTAAAMLFTLQIYCDFSGYCNMARGLAAMLGIRLTANFRYPLFSRNQTDFWHRWNISLTTWFRDYVYIPLGGSRHGQFRTCCNILIVFVLSGLWHGAAFNYVTWGMVCGVLIILTRLAGQTGLRPGNEPSDKPGDLLRIASNLYLIIITFVIFRLNDTERSIIVIEQIWWPLLLIISTLLGGGILCRQLHLNVYILLGGTALLVVAVIWTVFSPGLALALAVTGILPASITGMLATEWCGRHRSFALERMSLLHRNMRLAVYWILTSAILLSNSGGRQFIYYQF